MKSKLFALAMLCFAGVASAESGSGPALAPVDTLTCAQMQAEMTVAGQAMGQNMDPNLAANIEQMRDGAQSNMAEAGGEMLGAGAVGTLGDAITAAAWLARQFPAVVVTAGGAGLAAFEARGGGFSIPAEKVIVQSTHGAGDVFTGTLAATLAAGGGLEAACRAGSQAAAAHVAGR